MPVTFSGDDLHLLGYDDVTRLGDVGTASAAFKCVARSGISAQTHHFLYVRSDAAKEELDRLAGRFGNLPDLYVIANRSGPTNIALRTAFKRAVGIHLVDELLWDRVSGALARYTQGIQEDVPQEPYFVVPRAEELKDKERLDDVLLRKLKGQFESAQLLVIKAPAGVGKRRCRVSLSGPLPKTPRLG